MSDALQIFAADRAWSDRTREAASVTYSMRGSDAQQRLFAVAAALAAWSLIGALAWLAIGWP